MKNTLLSLFFFAFFISKLHAYTVSPTCPDFTDINASYVEAFYGNTGNPFTNSGVVLGRHTEITTQGTDPNTGNALQLLPAGESKVIRLGNDQVGAQAEALTYHFIVDKDNPILLVKFAVIMEDPNHDFSSQPRFIMRIMDKNGKLIEACSEYDVTAGAGIPGFQTINKITPIHWRDWTNVGLDMSAFAGQEVQVQFTTYDCAGGAHYGYAYFTAKCASNKLQINACTGNNFTLEAPADFSSYLWDNGDKTRTSTRNKTAGDMSMSCLVTSATGCQFRLSAYASSSVIPTQNTDYTATVCEGQPYKQNFYNLPAQTQVGTFSYYNTFFNPNTCSSSATSTLQLTVLQTFYHIKTAICQGEDYTKNNFNIIQPAAGVLMDTLRYKSKSTACDSIVCLELTVNSSFNMPNSITGDTSPCSNRLVNYSFAGNTGLTDYLWEVPANASIVSGQGFNQITVYFNDATPGNIVLKGENGCGTGAIPLPVKPRRTYETLITDSICTGNVYNKHSFNLGKQDIAGYYTYEHREKTILGCDSITTLELFVFPTPTVKIVTQNDTVLCSNQPITLHALANNASANFGQTGKIAPGDVYCTDGSIVKALDYLLNPNGKTAAGIVFYVDGSGQHGWIVDLKPKYFPIDNIVWSYTNNSIPGLPQTGWDYLDIASDLDGYSNTRAIRNALPQNNSVAAWAVDFNNGWYLPSVGQSSLLHGIYYSHIRGMTSRCGGTDWGSGSYWTSSEPGGFTSPNAFVFDFGYMGGSGAHGKMGSNGVIQVRNF